jgi:hypothetical protein
MTASLPSAYQRIAVEHWIEVTLPLRDVVTGHRAQMHVADASVAQAVHEQAPRVLPLVVPQAGRGRRAHGFDDHVARLVARALDSKPHLGARRVAQERAQRWAGQRGCPIHVDDHVAGAHVDTGACERRQVIRVIRVAAIHVHHPVPAGLHVARKLGA